MGSVEMTSFEKACADTERAAEAALQAAKELAARARALKKAAHTGRIATIRREQEKIGEALAALQREDFSITSFWPFSQEEEVQFLRDRYINELLQVAQKKRLNIHKQDRILVSYPSVVKIVPKDRAVQVDRKKVSDIRPSHLVNFLIHNQNRQSGFKPKQFIETLYRVYKDITSNAPNGPLNAGRIILLIRIYKLITALPGSAVDYTQQDFARDVYLLDRDGPRETRDGAAVSFPSSTGTRQPSKNLLFFTDPSGNNVKYCGISFRKNPS